MRELNGWWLPHDDGYFDNFVKNAGQYKKNGFQREHLLEAFRYVKKFECAIDVGAHVGFWTRDMAEKFHAVYAFEPALDTYQCLQRNMAEHYNVRTLQIALGPVTGRVQIMADEKRNKDQSGSKWVKVVEKGPVVMAALDSYDLRCDLLKIDVEGFELYVLEGARKTISASKPVIIMETDKNFSEKRYGSRSNEPFKFVRDLGYQVAAHMRPDTVFIPL